MNGMNQQPNGNANGNDFALNYQPNDILQKEFKTKMRGYDPTEVDQFLDGIIKDYETLTNEVNQLKSDNERLLQARGTGNNTNGANFQQPRQQNRRPQATKPASSSIAEGSTNYDILKRVSNLEKRVFGHDFANGVPENNDAKQFASAVVPNNMETGHTEINPRMNAQSNNNNNFNGNNNGQNNNQNNQNNYQPNRPVNNFNGNLSNNNNFNQF